jgi:hypothetical protein
MPIILDNKDGPNLGPGQSYGYQGQYQGQRQPGIDQANMGGPQMGGPQYEHPIYRPSPDEISRFGPPASLFNKRPGFRSRGREAYPGYNTSETARENYISRTDGGYPKRYDEPTGRSLRDIFKDYGPDKFQDYLDKGLGSLPRSSMEAIPMPLPKDFEAPDPMPMPLPNDYEAGPMQPMAAVDPSDWRTLETILGAGGNPDDYMQMAGYVPGSYDDDDYGSYIPDSVLDMDMDFIYGPNDEHNFDRKKGYENRIWGIEPEYSSGIMGAMPEERQMAELTQDQMNMMGNPLNTPDFGVSKEDLYNRTKDMEDKGFFGFGAQEPTTQEEFNDYYRQLQQGSVGNWVT